MSRWGHRRFPPTKREEAIQFNAAERFYAGAADKEPINQRVIAPKRDRIKRADGKPLVPTEHQEQASVISWWYLSHTQYRLPLFALYAVPNGGARDAITGSRLKAEGVRPGTPDLQLAKPNRKYHGLYIEMKKIDAPKPSAEQTAFIDYLLSVGYLATVHYGAPSAIEEIKRYLQFDETMALVP